MIMLFRSPRITIAFSTLFLLFHICHCNILKKAFGKNNGLIDDIPTMTMSNKRKIPLVGLGVGNQMHEFIEDLVAEGIQADKRTRLIDTARVSENEKYIAKGITKGVAKFKETENIEGKVQVHVVTKVWYTHLGYERTIISVQESLGQLTEAVDDENVDLKVHFLIHWPRCYNTIEWMECEEEENALPQHVKDAGPPPHIDRKNAWQGTWKALEDMYDKHSVIGGIGVSNFSVEDMETLIDVARIKPHIHQLNVWSLLHDPLLVDLCHRNDIHMQAYNVMNGVIRRFPEAPRAHHHLLQVANEITKKEMKDDSVNNGNNNNKKQQNQLKHPVTAAQTILKWLTQHGISIIPRTGNMVRLAENSAMAMSQIPEMHDGHVEIVAHGMEALLTGKDLEVDTHVKVTFHAKNQDVFLYWTDRSAGTEKQISYIAAGESFEESTHPQHSFKIYNAYDPDVYQEYIVEGSYGDHHHIHVEL